MGLATIDPPNVKEHTEFHKIPKLVLKKKPEMFSSLCSADFVSGGESVFSFFQSL